MATNIPTTESTKLKHNWRQGHVNVVLTDDTTLYVPLAQGMVPKTTLELFKFVTGATLAEDIDVEIIKVASGVAPGSITPGPTNRIIGATVIGADEDLGVVTSGDVTAVNEGVNVLAEGEYAWAVVTVPAATLGADTNTLGIFWLERTWQD